MAKEQKLLILPVNPTKDHDLTERLKLEDGWEIEQVSLSPWGENQQGHIVAVVLSRHRQEPRRAYERPREAGT